MNVLITGGGGFAGCNLIEYFAERGHHVTGIFRNTKIKAKAPCTLIKKDLSKRIEIDDSFDAIIHTACAPVGDFQTCHQDNIDSMQNLISFAREKGVRTIINFSTRSIYGEVRENEVFENTDIINPNYYGMSKYAAECLLRDAHDINGISIRLPGIAGPGAHNIWLTATVEKFIRNEPVVISDFFTKNFVWIFDIASFIEKLIFTSMEGQKFKYHTMNLACRDGARNIDIAEEIKRYTKSKSKITVIPPENNLFILRADKAFEMGFVPHTTMEIVRLYLDTLDIR